MAATDLYKDRKYRQTPILQSMAKTHLCAPRSFSVSIPFNRVYHIQRARTRGILAGMTELDNTLFPHFSVYGRGAAHGCFGGLNCIVLIRMLS